MDESTIKYTTSIIFARHKIRKNFVVIKTHPLMKDQDKNKHLVETAKKAAFIHSSCKHVNIVRTIEHFECNSRYYLVTNFQSGGDMIDYLNNL